MNHSHSHAHGQAHGAGAGSGSADRRWLLTAAGIIVVFLLGEAAVGFLTGSLALLSDAAHMLSDAAALVVAVIASRVAERPARGAYTYGFARVDALSGQLSGITLVLLAVWFVVEGVRRLVHPPDVPGLPVLITAVVGLGVNLLATWCAGRASRDGLNVRGALAHLVTDAWAFAATLLAGVVILVSGWTRADAVASLVVAVLMAWTGWGLVRDAGRVFLEAAPSGLDPVQLGEALARVPGVDAVHDLHVWDLGGGTIALSAHVLVDSHAECHAVSERVRRELDGTFGIHHATLQAEHAPGSELGAAADCVDVHGPVHLPPSALGVDGNVDVSTLR